MPHPLRVSLVIVGILFIMISGSIMAQSVTLTEEMVIETGQGSVINVAWSPDGSQLATAGFNKTVKLWDAVTGNLIFELVGHEREVVSLAWTQDGQRLASGGLQGTARIWDTSTGEQLLVIDTGLAFVNAVIWLHDDSQLIVAADELRDSESNQEPGHAIQVYDATTGEQLQNITGQHPSGINSATLSPDTTRLATGSFDGAIRIWNTETWTQTTYLTPDFNGITGLRYSPDGNHLALSTFDETIEVIAAGSGVSVITLAGHTQFIGHVAWSPDGRFIVSSSGSAIGERGDDTVRIWNAQTGEQLASGATHTNGVRSVAWSPDGSQLASVSDDGTLRIWSVTAGE